MVSATDPEDDIVAVASAPGAAARGIVRLSGPRAAAIVARVVSPGEPPTPTKGTCTSWAATIALPAPWPAVPCRVLLWPTSRSYTRSPSAELHTAGCGPLLEAATSAVVAAGARPARPGEFTLRAFLAGRIDLTQAEAVLGVIDAEDQGRLSAALVQLAGGMSGPLAELREHLLDDLADVEASLDFAEEDLDFVHRDELAKRLAAGATLARDMTHRMTQRSRADVLPRVVLFGPPNAGKSTLFNALTGEDAALCSETAGTTRDVVTAVLTHEGRACQLIDVAGTDDATKGEASSQLDRLAGRAARAAAQDADLIIVCSPVDASTANVHANRSSSESLRASGRTLGVLTKCDQGDEATTGGLRVSSRTGQGLERLRRLVFERLDGADRATSAQWTPAAAARCRAGMETAAQSLRRAEEIVTSGEFDDLLAEELRAAAHAIGEITGAVYVDDVLDRVFSRFCVGK